MSATVVDKPNVPAAKGVTKSGFKGCTMALRPADRKPGFTSRGLVVALASIYLPSGSLCSQGIRLRYSLPCQGNFASICFGEPCRYAASFLSHVCTGETGEFFKHSASDDLLGCAGPKNMGQEQGRTTATKKSPREGPEKSSPKNLRGPKRAGSGKEKLMAAPLSCFAPLPSHPSCPSRPVDLHKNSAPC